MEILKEQILKYREIVSYVIVGGLTTLVSLGSYYFCVITVCNPDIPWQLQAANFISWICAVAFAFITNRKYVFGSVNNIWQEFVKFYGGRITTLVVDMACMFLFVTILSVNDKIAKLLVQIIVFVANYVVSKFFVFK